MSIYRFPGTCSMPGPTKHSLHESYKLLLYKWIIVENPAHSQFGIRAIWYTLFHQNSEILKEILLNQITTAHDLFVFVYFSIISRCKNLLYDCVWGVWTRMGGSYTDRRNTRGKNSYIYHTWYHIQSITTHIISTIYIKWFNKQILYHLRLEQMMMFC